jgi:hypothetical protein
MWLKFTYFRPLRFHNAPEWSSLQKTVHKLIGSKAPALLKINYDRKKFSSAVQFPDLKI